MCLVKKMFFKLKLLILMIFNLNIIDLTISINEINNTYIKYFFIVPLNYL